MQSLKLVTVFFVLTFSLVLVAWADGNVAPGSDTSAATTTATTPEPTVVPELVFERADAETQAAAVAHFARSRALLVSALEEFDRACKIAKPDSILNSREWRTDLIDRAKDLEVILAPQPRITHRGVKLEGDNRLLKTEAKPR